MTEHFRQFLSVKIGTSMAKRYSDMVKMMESADYPTEILQLSHGKPVKGVSAETIENMRGFSDSDWANTYNRYKASPRYTTRGLSTYALAEIRTLISEYKPDN